MRNWADRDARASSTAESGARGDVADLGTVSRVVLVAGFTVVEAAVLAVWLEFVRGEALLSMAVAIGLGALVVGLIVEHLLTDVAVNGPNLDFPIGSIVAFSASETVLWGVWLQIAETVGGLVGVVGAGVVLAALLVPQHTIEDNVLRGAPALGDLVDLDTLGFSVVEAAGATVWLALVFRPELVGGSIRGVDAATIGLAALAVALFVEHNVGVNFSRR